MGRLINVSSAWDRVCRPPENCIGGKILLDEAPSLGTDIAIRLTDVQVFYAGIQVTFDAYMKPGTDFSSTFTGLSGRGRDLNTGIGSFLVGARMGASLMATNLDSTPTTGTFRVGFAGAHSWGSRAEVSYFINPAPAPLDNLAIAYGWPAMQISQRTVQITRNQLEAALARSLVLWAPN